MCVAWKDTHTGYTKNFDDKSGALEVEAALSLWQARIDVVFDKQISLGMETAQPTKRFAPSTTELNST